MDWLGGHLVRWAHSWGQPTKWLTFMSLALPWWSWSGAQAWPRCKSQQLECNACSAFLPPEICWGTCMMAKKGTLINMRLMPSLWLGATWKLEGAGLPCVPGFSSHGPSSQMYPQLEAWRQWRMLWSVFIMHYMNKIKGKFSSHFNFTFILFCVKRTIPISFMLKGLNRITAQELIFQKTFVWLWNYILYNLLPVIEPDLPLHFLNKGSEVSFMYLQRNLTNCSEYKQAEHMIFGCNPMWLL